MESEKKVHSNKRFILYSGNKFEFRSKDGAYQKIEGRCVFALLQHHICNNISSRAGDASWDFDYNIQCNYLIGVDRK